MGRSHALRELLLRGTLLHTRPDERAKRARLFLKLKRTLAKHATAEEDVVYPLLTGPGEREDAARALYDDHAEMKIALQCAADAGLPAIATLSFRPLITRCSDGHVPAECARVMTDLGAIAVGANCEQDPQRMLPLLREMRSATNAPLAAQPAAFRTTDECHSFTRLPAFPDELETIQISRREFSEFGRLARNEGIAYAGGCCGCNAAYIRALAAGVNTAAPK